MSAGSQLLCRKGHVSWRTSLGESARLDLCGNIFLQAGKWAERVVLTATLGATSEAERLGSSKRPFEHNCILVLVPNKAKSSAMSQANKNGEVIDVSFHGPLVGLKCPVSLDLGQAAMCSCSLELNQPTLCPARMLKASPGAHAMSDFECAPWSFCWSPLVSSSQFRNCVGARLETGFEQVPRHQHGSDTTCE